MSAKVKSIVKQLAALEASLADYLQTEGRERFLSGASVNRWDALYRAQATVVTGLPSIFRSMTSPPRYAECKRAKKLA
jgi:hypothetical protein